MTTAKEIGQLRMPSIAGIRAAEDADVRVVCAADVHADLCAAALPDRRRRSCARLCPTVTKRASHRGHAGRTGGKACQDYRGDGIDERTDNR